VEQLADPNSALTRQWDEEHDQQLVRRMLATIQAEFNATTWQVFQMLVLEDRPAAEVAGRLGMTPNAVYVAKAHVLARLRAELSGLVDARLTIEAVFIRPLGRHAVS
jgi:RNA polymerase sigma-70 factor (ECF subfamily)